MKLNDQNLMVLRAVGQTLAFQRACERAKKATRAYADKKQALRMGWKGGSGKQVSR